LKFRVRGLPSARKAIEYDLRAIQTLHPEDSGSWCNWQHDGLLIRPVWVQLPPALLVIKGTAARWRVAQRSEQRPYKTTVEGSTPSAPSSNVHRKETTHGIKVLAAAYLALNQVGEGSSPSSPTRIGTKYHEPRFQFDTKHKHEGPNTSKHWSSSGQDAALVAQ
jgi:hypothetical protein